MRIVEINHSVLFVHGVQEFLRIQKIFGSCFVFQISSWISANF